MKLFYFDVETTGLDAKENDIVQLAGMVEIDGVVKQKFNFDVRPVNEEAISDEALNVIGKTKEELMTYRASEDVYKDFIGMMNMYVNRYDKTDKMYPVGYNVQFDVGFLREWFFKNNNKYYGAYFHYIPIDPLAMVRLFEVLGHWKLENYKLETVCKHLGIKLDAHDAYSDIDGTKQLYEYIVSKIVL